MNEAELKRQFEERKPVLHAMGEWVSEYVRLKLKDQLGSESELEKFLQIPPKPRVKETDSFLEKALVRKKKDNPLNEIHDQVGLRFVVLLLEDISKIGEIIESGPWNWQKDRDHEQERLERPDYFAYQSDHYVVYTKEPIEYKEISIPANIFCEVQIRTILQHAYAEMAHKVDYKPSIKLPEEEQRHVKRSLAKGSALIETTDDVFREIKCKLQTYSQSTDALLEKASELYTKLTGETANPFSPLGIMVADTYREQIRALTPDALQNWVDENLWFGESLKKKRESSVFFRDSVVVLLGFLVTKNQSSVPKKWPIDSSYLEDLYIALGISTDGIF